MNQANIDQLRVDITAATAAANDANAETVRINTQANLDRASAALIIRKSNHPIILLVLDRKFNFIAYRVMAGVEVS